MKTQPPAYTMSEIIEIANKSARKQALYLYRIHGIEDTDGEIEHDLSMSFVLGANEALNRAEEGEAIRSYQWKYGTGFLLKRRQEIIQENEVHKVNTKIDRTGGAYDRNLGYILTEEGRNPLEKLLNKELKTFVVKALKKLPKNVLAVIKLYARGLEYREISKKIKMSEKTVRSYTCRGLQLLRESLRTY